MKNYIALAFLSMATCGYVNAMEVTKALRLNAEQFGTLQSLITDETLKGFVEETTDRFKDEYSQGMPDFMWTNLDGQALQWIVNHAEVINDADNYRSADSLKHDLDMMILQDKIQKRPMTDVGNIVYAASFLGIQPILDVFRGLFGNPTRISPELLELAFTYKDIEFADYSQLLISLAGCDGYGMSRTKEDKLAMIKQLLDPRLKANTTVSDRFGETALSRAIGIKDHACAELLLRSKVNPNIRGVYNEQVQSACLWIAYYKLDTTMFRLLLEWEADVNVRDSRGQTLLMATIKDNQTFFAWRLLDFGIDVNAQDDDQVTALMRATGKHDADMVKAILEKGVKNIDCIDQWGETALCWAARSGTTEIVQLLLDAGADASFTNAKTKKTVLDLAIEKASEDDARKGIVDLLKTHLAKK